MVDERLEKRWVCEDGILNSHPTDLEVSGVTLDFFQ